MSRSVPIRRAQFDVQSFAAWLASEGAEIGIPTNAYEVIRYKAYWRGTTKAATHIVYTKENGLLTWTGGSLGHYRAMLDGTPIDNLLTATRKKVAPVKTVSKSENKRVKIAQRDGNDCWFCGRGMGSDRTLEHLVPKSKGGPNNLDNYVLAHRECNNLAADMPLVEKIELRAKLRAELEQSAGASK
jgi:hypothetical protein